MPRTIATLGVWVCLTWTTRNRRRVRLSYLDIFVYFFLRLLLSFTGNASNYSCCYISKFTQFLACWLARQIWKTRLNLYVLSERTRPPKMPVLLTPDFLVVVTLNCWMHVVIMVRPCLSPWYAAKVQANLVCVVPNKSINWKVFYTDICCFFLSSWLVGLFK